MDTIHAVAEEHQELARSLAGQGVEYVFASFIDITGRAKSKCVPYRAPPRTDRRPRALHATGHG